MLTKIILLSHSRLTIHKSSSKSLAKEKIFEISKGSLIEIDTVLDLCIELHYYQKVNLQSLGELMQRTFSMLTNDQRITFTFDV